MSIAVIIPSKTASNIVPCVAAVRKHEPDAAIVIVDDGIDWPNAPDGMPDPREGDTIMQGAKPFCYSRNVNIGIRYALALGVDGVVLLNDDALLLTPGGFSTLARAVKDHPEYGIVGAVCNNVGNPNQWPKHIGLRLEGRMVCFICVYVPRATIEKVGMLDEIFSDYGVEDDDYCLRVRQAGLFIGIHDDCEVDHGTLKSSYRGDPKNPADFHPNLQRFIDKWGFDNWGRAV